jgi:hypothetical protein
MINLLYLATISLLISAPRKAEIMIENSLDQDRAEVISIPLYQLEEMLGPDFPKSELTLVEIGTGNSTEIQWVDEDLDGYFDVLLFWTEIGSNERKSYQVILSKDSKPAPKDARTTYGRFAPERIDDFAWENDKVAFRTYGPEAQRLTDGGFKGGTLTSGIDCWLKRVDYPIINKWYQKHMDGGSYHKDEGEGYDPYHVGDSRGIGGIGVQVGEELHVSKNFISHRIISTGKLRTVFELTYAPWSADGITILETKRISLDRGSRLFKMELLLKPDSPLPNLTTAITLHDGNGKTNLDSKAGWFRYWEQIDDSNLGTAIVVNPSLILSHQEKRSPLKDQSHLLISLDPKQNLSYFAGFAWEKSAEITSPEEWDKYLIAFSKALAKPLKITYR